MNPTWRQSSIQIDNKLDWNKHISTVAARGQSKLAFLNRNLKGCPKKLRDTAYISLISEEKLVLPKYDVY